MMVRVAILLAAAPLLPPVTIQAQTGAPLLSELGPTFVVPDNQLSRHVVVIAYGDMRFHDPSDPKPKVANPSARQALVAKPTVQPTSAGYGRRRTPTPRAPHRRFRRV